MNFMTYFKPKPGPLEGMMVDEEMKSLIVDSQAETIMGLRTKLAEAERKLAVAESDDAALRKAIDDFLNASNEEDLESLIHRTLEHVTQEDVNPHPGKRLLRELDEAEQRATVAEAGEARLRGFVGKVNERLTRGASTTMEGTKLSGLNRVEATKLNDVAEQLLSTPSPGAKIVEALEEIRRLFEQNPKFALYSKHNLCDAHMMDLMIRTDGKEEHFEADWLKDVWAAYRAALGRE